MNDRTRSGSPRVEVVICVHTDTRPVERAVASALRNEVSLVVTVVAHNTPSHGIRVRLGGLAADPRVRVLELLDGVRSPANAFNFGLDNAIGEFFSLVGSDDELSAGALDAWVALADRTDAQVVVAPIRRAGGGAVPSPRVRRGRTSDLDGDRDRLFERTAPLGIFRPARFPGLRFTQGLPRGVDQSFGLHLWFSGAGVAFDPSSPPYIEHDDQVDRVTRVDSPAADDLAYFEAIEADPVFQSMTPAARRALAAKIIRVHVIASISTHIRDEGLNDDDRRSIASAVRRLRGWAPGVDGILAIRDRRALKAALRPGVPAAQLRAAVGDRSRYLVPGALLTGNPLRIFHRHAPLRSLAAGRAVMRAVNEAARR